MKQSTLKKYLLKLSQAWHKNSFKGLKKLLQWIQYFCFILVPYQLWQKNIIAALAFVLCSICIFHARESIQDYEKNLIFDDFKGNRSLRRRKWAAVFRLRRKQRGW